MHKKGEGRDGKDPSDNMEPCIFTVPIVFPIFLKYQHYLQYVGRIVHTITRLRESNCQIKFCDYLSLNS